MFDFKIEYINAILTLNKSCGAGLATIGLAGAGVGVGIVFGSLVFALGRNLSEETRLFKYAMLGFALPELEILSISLILNILCITILLHKYFRENIQYIFFWDILVPRILLILPIIVSLFFYIKTKNVINSVIFCIILHIFIVLPLILYLNRIRNWSTELFMESGKKNHFSWGTPFLACDLAFIFIYIYIFIFLLCGVRWLNIGMTRDLQPFFNLIFQQEALPIYVWVLTMTPLFYALLKEFQYIKNILTQKFYAFCLSIHLCLIQNNFYFSALHYLHKKFYYLIAKISYPGPAYHLKKNPSILERIIFYIYMRGNLLWVMFFILLCIFEIYSSMSLYYFYYFLFLFMVLKTLWFIIDTIGWQAWVSNVCKSDYLYQNYTTPHYPQAMALYLSNTELFFGFTWNYTKDEFFKIQILKNLNQVEDRRPPRDFSKYTTYYFNIQKRVAKSHVFGRGYSIMSSFNEFNYGYNHVFKRYTHTAISRTTSVIVSNYENIFNNIALLNLGGWKPHYQLITKNLVVKNLPEFFENPMYVYTGNLKVSSIFDSLFPYHFYSVQKQGIFAEPYNKVKHIGYPTRQVAPDIMLTSDRWNNFNFFTKASIDIKAMTMSNWANIVICCNTLEYGPILQEFVTQNIPVPLRTPEFHLLFQNLKNEPTLPNWLALCELIGDPRLLPPLCIKEYIPTENFSPTAQLAYKQAVEKILQINNFIEKQNYNHVNDKAAIAWWKKISSSTDIIINE